MYDDDSAGFGAEFIIDAGGSFNELRQLADLAESTEGKLVASFSRIEKAGESMVDLRAAKASIAGFAESASRDLGQVGKTKEALDRILGRAIAVTTLAPALTGQSAAAGREMAKTEKELEKLIRAIDRETAAVGRSREEQRQARIEELAIAAARQGNTDVLDRLDAATRKLSQARDALAEDQFAAKIAAETAALAEQMRVQALAIEQLRERERLEAAIGRINGTDRPRARDAGATFSALDAKLAEDEARALREAAAAYQAFEAACRRGSQAMRDQEQASREAAAAQADLETRTRRFIASINPAAAAQDRFNDEMAEARKLVSAGAVSLDDYCTKLRQEQAVLEGAVDAHKRGAGSAGAHRAAMQGLSFQAQDAFTQISMGTNVLNVLAIQGGQAAGQMANMGGKLGAVASFMIGPWGLAITGGMLVLGALTDKLFDNEDASKKAAEGMKKFQDRQSDIGNFIDATTGKLTEQNRTLVLNAILTRQAQIRDNEKAITEGRNNAFRTAGNQQTRSPSYTGSSVGIPVAMRETDPDVRKAIQAAGGDVDKLASSIARLAATKRPDLKGLALDITSQAGAAILAARENKKLDGEVKALTGSNTALATSTTGLIEKQVALATATTPLARARAELALVQQGAAAADKAGGAALVKYRSDLTAATRAVQSAEAAEKATAEARREATRATNRAAAEARKEQTHAENLAREAEAIEAQTRNLIGLAAAWGQAGGAALIAEASVTAETKAIRARGDVDAFVARQIALLIAQRVADAAKATASMREEAAIQAKVNAEVAAGLVPAERANELVRERMADLPLLHAIEAAQQKGLTAEVDRATAALKAQREARASLQTADADSFYTGAAKQAERQLALQREELRLVGTTDMERARSMARIQAIQTLQAKGLDVTTKSAQDYIANQVKIAEGTETVRQAQAKWNAELTATGDLWETIDDAAQSAANGMADAFGRFGSAVGDALTVVTGFYADQARLQEQHAKAIHDAGVDQVAIARENRLFAIRSSSQQIAAYGNMASAAKGFFKEGSAGYKAMAAAEKVYRVAQLAASIAAMIQNGVETTVSVANSTARATAAGAEGIATQSKLIFPFNIAAMAATGAALVAAGIAVFGGGGGGGAAPAAKTAEDWQKGQGTGSILGDASAKSESLGKALDLMQRNSNKDLEYSSEMVRALRAIETNLGSLAAAVSRQLSAGGGLDASSLQLGTNTSGGLLGSGLFSKKITRELNDAGLQFDGTSVAQAIAGGIQANLYQEVLKTTKKSGLFGIGGSTKTSIETTRTAADAGLTTEVALLIGKMRKAIVEAAGTIGIDGAAAMLDAFQINIGRISFKDLTAEEIESELAAVFSRVGDDMAAAVGSGLSAFQRAGEGMLETLVRLAKEYQTVDVALRSIGMTFGAVGLASVGARTALVDLFGGLDAFTEQTAFFRENFLSEAEQMAPVIAAVKAEMDRLGLAGVTTKDAFKSVVLGLDLSTEGGRETYAALMAVAPAFAKTSDYLASLNGELKETAKTAEQLAAIEKQRRGLEIQLMEATGNTAGALAAKRADELAAIDPMNRALQQSVWMAQDAAQAARELAAANEEAARTAAAAAEEALRAATAVAQQRRVLEIALMEAKGDSAAALAARQADELAAMDASLRALQQSIWAAEAATAAQNALAEAQAAAAQTAADLAQQRRSMEIELMETLGDVAGAQAARRADEVAGTDASLRALREQIHAAQDAAAANAALAQAQETAAQAARTAADAAAQLARQRAALDIALLRAQGQETQAVNAERALQLEGTDETLRALQQQVWMAEDARAAAETAAQAQAALVQQQQQAAQAAEQLRKTRAGMQAELLDAIGDAAGAKTLRRLESLAELDPSLRALQELIWRQQGVAEAVSKARDTLTASYEREAAAIGETIERFGGFRDSLRAFRDELGAGDGATADAYRAAQARFVDTSALAARGDAKAMGELDGISKEFLAASRDRAGSLEEYQRDVARVAGAVDRAIGASDEAIDYAQLQLEALKRSVDGLIDVNESVVSVHDAVLALRAAMSAAPITAPAPLPPPPASQAAQPAPIDMAGVERRIEESDSRRSVEMAALVEKVGKVSRLAERWDVDGLPVRNSDDGPLQVKDVGTQTETTAEAQPA